jgi:hypothetical protein
MAEVKTMGALRRYIREPTGTPRQLSPFAFVKGRQFVLTQMVRNADGTARVRYHTFCEAVKRTGDVLLYTTSDVATHTVAFMKNDAGISVARVEALWPQWDMFIVKRTLHLSELGSDTRIYPYNEGTEICEMQLRNVY